MSEKNVTYGVNVGFFGLLALVFIVLKLTGHIAWSWWWVLAPIWIPWGIVLSVVVVVALVFAGIKVLESFPSRRLR